MVTAIIGGSGLSKFSGMEIHREHAVATPYGPTSAPIQEGRVDGCDGVLFLHRHGGRGQPIPPHLVNYRANIWALKELGATRIIAANAVGAINAQLRPGRLVIPDQLIDYTSGREHTFDDGSSGSIMHIDFTHPFDEELRKELLAAALYTAIPCDDGAVLAVVQGPRLETAAEIKHVARDGCDIVGMTTMPEASLAREAGIAYAVVAMIVNAAAGLEDQPLSFDRIRENLQRETELFAVLVAGLLAHEASVVAP